MPLKMHPLSACSPQGLTWMWVVVSRHILHCQIEKMWLTAGNWKVTRTYAHLGQMLRGYSLNIHIWQIPVCLQVDLRTTCLGQLGISWEPSLHKLPILATFWIVLPGHICGCSCFVREDEVNHIVINKYYYYTTGWYHKKDRVYGMWEIWQLSCYFSVVLLFH